jgi:hypothetical protein
MAFNKNRIEGAGVDAVQGEFTLTGNYHVSSGAVEIIK